MQCNQKFELVDRARQFTYTLKHPLSLVTRKVNTWIGSEVYGSRDQYMDTKEGRTIFGYILKVGT